MKIESNLKFINFINRITKTNEGNDGLDKQSPKIHTYLYRITVFTVRYDFLTHAEHMNRYMRKIHYHQFIPQYQINIKYFNVSLALRQKLTRMDTTLDLR